VRPGKAIVQSLLILAAVVVGSELCAWLLTLILPANRTSNFATICMLAWAVLKFGGPIVGLFLAISSLVRNSRNPSAVMEPGGSPVIDKRKRRVLFVAIGLPVGFTLAGLGLVMIIPAVWLAGGGDMPMGYFKPSQLETQKMILYAIMGIGAVGIVLLISSLVAGVGLLLTREK